MAADTVTMTLDCEEAAFLARILRWGGQGMCNYAQDLLDDWQAATDDVSAEVRKEAFNGALADARRAGHMIPSLAAILTGAVTRTSV
jgi:CelD/BcsL family acetyltransferase involved in cellulose biosynthesis